MGLHLIIGNKNYSSWSMRPWIAMKVAGIPFEETVISLDELFGTIDAMQMRKREMSEG